MLNTGEVRPAGPTSPRAARARAGGLGPAALAEAVQQAVDRARGRAGLRQVQRADRRRRRRGELPQRLSPATCVLSTERE